MASTDHKAPQIAALESPKSSPLIRVTAMPADANPNGDIFGGWLLAQMDLPVNHPELGEEGGFREELMIVTAGSVRQLDDILGRSEVRIIVFRVGCSYRQRLENLLAMRGVVATRCLQFAVWTAFAALCANLDIWSIRHLVYR